MVLVEAHDNRLRRRSKVLCIDYGNVKIRSRRLSAGFPALLKMESFILKKAANTRLGHPGDPPMSRTVAGGILRLLPLVSSHCLVFPC